MLALQVDSCINYILSYNYCADAVMHLLHNDLYCYICRSLKKNLYNF